MADKKFFQGNQAESVQPDKPVFDKINHIWKSVFSAIAFLTLPFCFFSTMLMPSINTALFFVLVITWLILHFFTDFYEKKGKGRKAVRIFRILVLVCTVVYFIPNVLLTGFTQTEIFYPVKRYLYTHGVYSTAEFYDKILPEQLPDSCADYKFVTQGCMIAQDYHPSSYLIFHADESVLRSYAQKMENLNLEPLENIINGYGAEEWQSLDSYEQDYAIKQYGGIQMKFPPHYVSSQLLPVHQTDFLNSVIYYISGNYDKGCILDYDSGLVIFWT